MNRIASLTASAALLALAACGGGGGSGDGSGGGAGGGTGGTSTAPTLTSPTSITVEEQPFEADTDTLVELTASDADGDNVTFAILATKDGALFTIDDDDDLEFRAAPSFETPLDSDGDNIYELDIRVSDGALSSTATITVEVTDTVEGLSVELLASAVFGGGNSAVGIDYIREADRLIVADELGRVGLFDAEDGTLLKQMETPGSGATRLVDISAVDIDQSGAEFFALLRDSGVLILVYGNFDTERTIAVWSKDINVDADASIAFSGPSPLIAIGDPDRNGAAQDPDNPRGNLFGLQFDPDTLFSLNTIDPADVQVVEEVIGIGLRSPHLPKSEFLRVRYVMDRGERFNEYSINSPGGVPRNFQWPARDGNSELEFTGMVPGREITPQFVQEIGASTPGSERPVARWTDMGVGLDAEGWLTVSVIADENGNIYTRGEETEQPFEDRTRDFRNAGLLSDPIVSIVNADRDEDGDFDNESFLYMLDTSGSIFRVEASDD